jgi:hypothetical protein
LLILRLVPPHFPAIQLRHATAPRGRSTSSGFPKLENSFVNRFIDNLEPRRLFAAFNGTPGSDFIRVYVSGGLSHVVVNGVDQMTFDAQLDINTGDGNDQIEIDAVPGLTLASINPGEGENDIYIGNGDFDTNIQGNIQVLGQAGDDRIVVYDQADGYADFNYYEFTSSTFRKPSSTMSEIYFASVETFNVEGSPQSDGIKIISTAPETFLTWRSGAGDDIVYVGDGDLGLIRGDLQVSTESGTDSVILDDHAAAGPFTYDVYNQSVERPGFAYFDTNSAEQHVLSASAGSDTINVRTGSGAIAPWYIAAGGGDDTIKHHTNWYTQLAQQKSVDIDGGTGNDTVNFNTRTGGIYSVRDFYLNGSFLPTYSYNAVEQLNVNGDNGSQMVLVWSTRASVNTALDLTGGDDTIYMGGTFSGPNVLDNIKGPVNVSGGAGADLLYFNDYSQTAAQDWTISASTVGRTNMAAVGYAGIEAVNFIGGANADRYVVNSTNAAAPLSIDSYAGYDSLTVHETAPGSFVTFDGGAELDQIAVNDDSVGSAAVHLRYTQDLLSLTIGTGGSAVLEAGGDRVIKTGGLAIGAGGRLDLTDNSLIVDYTADSPAHDIRSWLISGRGGGNWNGAAGGIFSSVAGAHPGTAIGQMESEELFGHGPPIFAGQTVDPTAVLVGYTLVGDFNLDRAVDLDDFNRLASAFGRGEKTWSDGDANYDGNVNLQDFNLLASRFGQSLSPMFAAAGQKEVLFE